MGRESSNGHGQSAATSADSLANSRDDVEKNEYAHKSLTKKVTYTTSDPFVEQTVRRIPLGRIDPNRWEKPIHDPQDNLENRFTTIFKHVF
jgi:hypothetical protein